MPGTRRGVCAIAVLQLSVFVGALPRAALVQLDRSLAPSSVKIPGLIAFCDPNFVWHQQDLIASKYANARNLLTVQRNYQNEVYAGVAARVSTIPTSTATDRSDTTKSSAAVPVAPNIPLIDSFIGEEDILYYASINVGTPAQQVTVDIDTGSADLWFAQACNDGCDTLDFEPSQSTTFVQLDDSFSIDYGKGSAQGTLGRDVISFGNYTVTSQDFGVVRGQATVLGDAPGCTGLMGMAFSSISRYQKPTFVENLIANNALAAPVFSVFLTRQQNKGSELCIGCMNPLKFSGPTVWAPLVSRTWWTVNITGLKVSALENLKYTTFDAALIATIDTGSSLIHLPPAVAKAVYDGIPGSVSASQFGYPDQSWAFPCASGPSVAFNIGGHLLAMSPKDFSIGNVPGNPIYCVGSVMGLDGDEFPSNFAILGDAYLKSWYTTFDYSNNGRIGFTAAMGQ